MKILFITKKSLTSNLGGREQLSKNLQFCLSSIFKDEFFTYELEQSKKNIFYYIFTLFGYIDGINIKSINEIIDYIEKNKINKIFIDGSNLGLLTHKIKNKRLKIEIYTFFHNVESHFFKELFLINKSIKNFIIWIVNYYVEKKSIIFSDKVICLNKRDSDELFRLYNRNADYEFPMIIKDNLLKKIYNNQNNLSDNEKYILFVGGNFYGNIHGIKWFVKNVVPKINIKLKIAGFGMENYRSILEVNNKVKVVGSLKSLNELYKDALLVITPIFKGSGMKTKVAESLMFGKMVLASKEAATGYDLAPSDILIKCFDKDKFIEVINSFDKNKINIFNQKSREIYEKYYSLNAGICRFKKIFFK